MPKLRGSRLVQRGTARNSAELRGTARRYPPVVIRCCLGQMILGPFSIRGKSGKFGKIGVDLIFWAVKEVKTVKMDGKNGSSLEQVPNFPKRSFTAYVSSNRFSNI